MGVAIVFTNGTEDSSPEIIGDVNDECKKATPTANKVNCVFIVLLLYHKSIKDAD